MSVHAIILSKPDQQAWDRVKDQWPQSHFILDERVAFVAPTDEDSLIVLTSDVSDKVGMNAQDRVAGLVIEIFSEGSYYGLNDPRLWEWLGKAL